MTEITLGKNIHVSEIQKFLRGLQKIINPQWHTPKGGRKENKHSKRELPQGTELNVNFPSASDTAWQSACPCRGPLAEPCKHSISETSSEYKKTWTPNIGFPCKRKNKNKRYFYKRKGLNCQVKI